MTYSSMSGYGQYPGYPPYGQSGHIPFHAPPPPEPGDRPVLVSAAAVMMLASAALLVISNGISAVTERSRELGATADILVSITVVALALVFAASWSIGVGVLALGVSRGRKKARVITWIVFAAGTLAILWGAIEWLDTEISPIWMIFQFTRALLGVAVMGLLALPTANNWFDAHFQAGGTGVT